MDVQTLIAKQAITEVLHRYARAMDRMDREMALNCWHPGGTDEHPPFYTGSAQGFVDWLWPEHAALEMTRHAISNVLIEVAGDRAGSECYWQVVLRKRVDGEIWDSISQGRYVDRFEQIDGVWAIRHRQSIFEWNRTEPVALQRGDPRLPVIVQGSTPFETRVVSRRDREDFSYDVLASPRR